MIATVYKVGDTLYERVNVVASGRMRRVVRKWIVVSAVIDVGVLDPDGRPVQVVTLRSWVGRDVLVLALMDWQLDQNMETAWSTWSRERPI